MPSNAYPCADGRAVVIGANQSANFRRLMTAIGRDDLAADATLAANPARVARQAEIDAAIGEWTKELAADEVVELLVAASVPASTIFTVADMFADPHYRARQLFERLEVDGRPLTLPAIAPRLSRTPATTEWAGRELGADTREVLRERAGVSDTEIAALATAGVIALAAGR